MTRTALCISVVGTTCSTSTHRLSITLRRSTGATRYQPIWCIGRMSESHSLRPLAVQTRMAAGPVRRSLQPLGARHRLVCQRRDGPRALDDHMGVEPNLGRQADLGSG